MHVARRSLFIGFIFLLSIIFYYISVLGSGLFLNIFALCFLIFVSIYLAIEVHYSWIFFLYFFGLIFAVSSNVFAEIFNSYLNEIQAYASLTGGGARNSFLVASFLCGVFISFRLFLRYFAFDLKKYLPLEVFLIRFLLFLGWVLIVYMAYVVFRYGSPLILGVDRFTYWKYFSPTGYRYISSLVPIFGFVLFYAREIGLLRNFYAFLWLFFCVILVVLSGEKFSGLLILAFFSLLPFFCVGLRRLSVSLKLFGFMVFLFLVGLVFLNYYLVYGYRFLEVFESRIVLQGQMLFALDAVSLNFPRNETILDGFFGKEKEEAGIRFLMFQIAPWELVQRHLEGGATFTTPFPANLTYFFGLYFSPLILIFFSFLVGGLGAVLFIALRKQAFLLGLVTLKVFFYVYQAVLMGEVHFLLGWKMLVYMSAVLLLILISFHKVRCDERRCGSIAGSV